MLLNIAIGSGRIGIHKTIQYTVFDSSKKKRKKLIDKKYIFITGFKIFVRHNPSKLKLVETLNMSNE